MLNFLEKTVIIEKLLRLCLFLNYSMLKILIFVEHKINLIYNILWGLIN